MLLLVGLWGSCGRQDIVTGSKWMNEIFHWKLFQHPWIFSRTHLLVKFPDIAKQEILVWLLKKHVETKGILKIKFTRTDTQSLIMITFRFMTTLLSRRQVEFNQFWISSVGIRRRDVKTRSQKLIYNWTPFNFVYCTSAKNLYGHNF